MKSDGRDGADRQGSLQRLVLPVSVDLLWRVGLESVCGEGYAGCGWSGAEEKAGIDSDRTGIEHWRVVNYGRIGHGSAVWQG